MLFWLLNNYFIFLFFAGDLRRGPRVHKLCSKVAGQRPWFKDSARKLIVRCIREQRQKACERDYIGWQRLHAARLVIHAPCKPKITKREDLQYQAYVYTCISGEKHWRVKKTFPWSSASAGTTTKGLQDHSCMRHAAQQSKAPQAWCRSGFRQWSRFQLKRQFKWLRLWLRAAESPSAADDGTREGSCRESCQRHVHRQQLLKTQVIHPVLCQDFLCTISVHIQSVPKRSWPKKKRSQTVKIKANVFKFSDFIVQTCQIHVSNFRVKNFFQTLTITVSVRT